MRTVTSFDKSDEAESEYMCLPYKNLDGSGSILTKMKGVGSFDDSDYMSTPSTFLEGLQNDIDHPMRRSNRGAKDTGKQGKCKPIGKNNCQKIT